MSLITQCPACSTFFRVVPDQLRISDGWVRCGQCDEVFDANASVRGDAQLAQTQEPAPQQQEAVDISATVAAELGAQDPVPAPVEVAAVAADVPDEVPAEAPVETPPEPVAAPAVQAPEADHFLSRSPKELSDFSSALVGADLSAVDAAATAAPAAEEGTERRYMQMFAAPTPGQADPKLSFMKPLKKPSRWTRPWARASLAVLGLVLAVALAGQVLLHERDRLAAQYPQFRGELAALSDAAGLELQPLRQIESVVIDSSAFSKLRNEVYKLSFTLRNTSATALATPAMELTLTDMQDQVLLRRVLTHKDLASLPVVLAGGAEQSATLSVAVRAPVAADKVAGYRLLAFYP